MTAAAPLTNIAEFTVSELSFAIKRTVEDAFGLVRLRGEISGYRGQHSSGHAYFSLKDDKAKIDAVIWRGTFRGLKFKPEEGLEVIVTGRLTTFPGKSSYQLVIEALEPAGAGALMALLEERKKKLAAEGLFDEARKRPLPFWPQVVGVVTSPTGAVIRDMLHGFTERCPSHVIVWPVRVQGDTCAAEVAAAIRGFNALTPLDPIPRPQLLIVARGGGSLEDLWGFNEEIVARAAAESKIPLISAVGHETDWTLIDLVADARAPTPTKAAEWAVPKHSDLAARLFECGERLRICLRRHLERAKAEFRGAERGLPRPAALLSVPQQRLDLAGGRLGHSLRLFSHQSRAKLDRLDVRLTPRLILTRVDRSQDRLKALRQHGRQCFLAAVSRKHRSFERASGRLHPGLIRVPASRGGERLTGLAARMRQALQSDVRRWRANLEAQGQLLRTLSHKSVLDRGFVLVRDTEGAMLRRKADIPPGSQALELEFADGRVFTHTGPLRTQSGAPTLPRKRDAKAASQSGGAPKPDDDSGQGSLL